MKFRSMMERRFVLPSLNILAIVLIIAAEVNVQATTYRSFNLQNVNGSFSSPNYPQRYPEDIDYEWIMPFTQQKLQLEFITMDLNRCYASKYRPCENDDHVSINFRSYCNWDRPPKTIILQPWSQTVITFFTYYSSVACRGIGFKVIYQPYRRQTTTMPPTPEPTSFTTDFNDASRGGNQTPSFSSIFLLVLLVIPLIIIIICLYWCCWRSGRLANQAGIQSNVNNCRRLANQEVQQSNVTTLHHQGGQPRGTPSREPPVCGTTRNVSRQDDVILTVDIPTNQPPLPTASSLSGDHTQNGQSMRAPLPVGHFVGQDNYRVDSHETLNHDPPPSYDEVWENENRNRITGFDSPPSYEAVMRQSRESLATESVNYDRQETLRLENQRLRVNLEPNSTRETNSRDRGDIYI